MMKIFEDQTFERFVDRDSKSVFSNMEFRRCRFVHCDISVTNDPRLRSTVRNVRLLDCRVDAHGLDPAVIDDVVVDGLRTDRLLQTWGTVFRHVTLQGRIGRLMFSGILCPTASMTPSIQRAFADANAAYYQGVDWALDISDAEFYECSIRGLPGRLIRRDTETQAVVSRRMAAEGRWRDLDLSRTWWATSLDFLLTDPARSNDPDVVLVAPKRNPKFRDLLAGIELLRREGIAEPD